ncbi:MAG: feruloyl-CoA synthase [Rhizobacter sp.]|nr:feruloyl-CoA synthase [Rhizobacter sp.]
MPETSSTPVRHATVGGSVHAVVERRPDGTTLVRSAEPLGEHPRRLSDRLEHWAAACPDRTFVARRDATGAWRAITFADMLQRARAVGEALLQRGLSEQRPVAILSGNGLEHLTLAMGAMWAGVPHVPVSVAYSLVSQDFGKLRHVLGLTTPGLVFAESPAFARAIAAAVPPDCEVVLAQGTLGDRQVTGFDELLAVEPSARVDAAHDLTGPDTIVKFLFTSGSTDMPKGVVNTHRMWCASQQMLRQCMAFLAEAPPLIVDWLPWNHTFGGNHNVGIALYNGGSLYIDDGNPTPAGVKQTLRNLRELSPTVYFNVPKGLEQIANAMDHDPVLRQCLFENLQAFMFSGASLSQAVWNKLDGHAVATTGARVRFITGIGMTETGPSGTLAVGPDARSGHIGLPEPGVIAKLVPIDGKTEVRFKGPAVFPGYWRSQAQTAKAFDDEGFYKTGDAVDWIDAHDPDRGLRFDGRIGEDFKLSSGTFVSVGPLRMKVILAGYPLVQDVVVTGLDRDDVGLLIFPRLDDCRERAGLPAAALACDVLRHEAVRAFFQELADRLWESGTGGANRPARLHVLVEPPSIDAGEATDKGSINQRAVLTRRKDLVELVHACTVPHGEVILPIASHRATA